MDFMHPKSFLLSTQAGILHPFKEQFVSTFDITSSCHLSDNAFIHSYIHHTFIDGLDSSVLCLLSKY